MKTKLLSLKSLKVAALGAFSASIASAIDFDFSGQFAQDNDVALLNFTVGVDSTITIFSSSWIEGGSGLGFDPILAIWDSNGNLIAEQDDGGNVGSTVSNGVSYDHGIWDSYYTQFLTAGSYTASIAQFNNFAVGSNLGDGFVHDNDPAFTQNFGPETYFNGVSGSNDARTGDWEFHILNAESASIVSAPDSGMTAALLSLGLLSIGFVRRRTLARD